MSQWLPISTAPKDETIVDLWSVKHGRLPNYRRIEWTPDNVFYDPVHSGVSVVRDATHWMPLPPLPNSVREVIVCESNALLLAHAANQIEGLVEALTRISHAKPDRLDHAQDVAIIERAARIASDALAKATTVDL